ncbi:hypothetical protein [Alkalibacterium sp. MB6]|uniref:hypothetical protein n=1 Tax=Alkalibacterium sp. MB6 TaxID=2081965 RepID=UPI00137B2DEB|nr:hypothetical protein [Alkalibacterium sp. MB6]
MTMIRNIIEQRWGMILFVLLLMLLGLFLIVTGIKVVKNNRLSGLLNIIIGFLFTAAMIYILLFLMFLGVNW